MLDQSLRTTTYLCGTQRCCTCGSVRNSRGVGEYRIHDNGTESLINCSDCSRENPKPKRTIGRDVACRYIVRLDGTTFWTDAAEIYLRNKHGAVIAKVGSFDAFPKPVRRKVWECLHCGELEAGAVTEELYGDQSCTYCNLCGGSSVSRIRPKPAPPLPRPKRFCLFIKAKDNLPEYYTRLEKILLALRIGYYQEAWRLIRGKGSNYIFEGLEDNPMPF